MCHAGTKSARPSIAPSPDPQWGLTLTEPLRPYSLDYNRRSRSDGRKLSTPSTSRAPAASVGHHQQTHWQVWTLLSPVPVSAKSTASQLVKNGEHRTKNHEHTKLVNKQLSDLWKIPTPEGHSISEPFRPEELASGLRRLNPGKSLGLDSIFTEFILHTGSALKSWFCDFLTSCMRQLKTPKIWKRALAVASPKPEKPLGTQIATVPYLCCVTPLKFSRDSSTLVPNQSSTHWSHRSKRAFDTGGRPWTRSPWWHKISRIAFRLRRRPELCFSTLSQQPTTLYGTTTSPASCCDCCLIDIGPHDHGDGWQSQFYPCHLKQQKE